VVIGSSLLSATGTTTTNSIGRKPPVWMSSGTYKLSKSVVKNPASSRDWFQKVNCITSLANTNLFQNLQAEAAHLKGLICSQVYHLFYTL
jgi:hypothetical protein